MREKIRKQLPLVEPSIEHEHAFELRQIQLIIAEHLEIFDLIREDLIRGLDDPKTGRKGEMTGEQVFKVLLIKQMNEFSYRVLQYHLADSRTYRAFCGFGIGDDIPSHSTLQRDIKKIRPETLEMINRLIIESAVDAGIERGRQVRVDCTVTESNIHHPTDSSLLWDCVRVLSRNTQAAKTAFGLELSNHSRRAKKRAMGILNARTKKVRKKHYRDLLKVAKKVVADSERVRDTLLVIGMTDVDAVAIGNELSHFIPLAQRAIDQTERRVIHGEKLKPAEKLVSIFEPHTDIIVKDRRDTYYGHKLALTGGSSGMITDLVIKEGNPADATIAKEMIERQIEIYGRPPLKVAYDGGFASRENLSEIKGLGVKEVMFPRKCGLEITDMVKSTWVYKRLRNFRAGIEGMISFLKRCFGLSRCLWRGLESFKAYAWSSVVTANLLLMSRRMREG